VPRSRYHRGVKKSRAAKARAGKAASRGASSSKKRRHVFNSVAEYLKRVPEPARSALNQMRAAIREAMPPDATEVISYNIPAFRDKKVLVWYAAFTDHCSLFPGAAVIEQCKDDLTGYKTAKGTVQFPLDKPLPLELIRKMARARVERE
jgi:uncharacterized protein YdhG (YjbR/CyaY superfamily)